MKKNISLKKKFKNTKKKKKKKKKKKNPSLSQKFDKVCPSTPRPLSTHDSTVVPVNSQSDNHREKERGAKMKLKVYADRMSQPSRAVIIFCK